MNFHEGNIAVKKFISKFLTMMALFLVLTAGIEYDGLNDRINCGSGSSLNNLGPLSVSCWFYADTQGESNSGRFCEKARDGGNQLGWFLTITATNQIAFIHLDNTLSGANQLDRRSSNNSFSLTTWHHLLLTWDGSQTAANAHIYIDGTEV